MRQTNIAREMEDREVETTPPSLRSIARNGLSLLLEIFGLSCNSPRSSSISDIVIIAIDFENIGSIKNGFTQKQNCQVGLALLDTKDLRRVSPSKLISTYNFATGSPSYLAKASKKFLFGESITTQASDMLDRIESVIPQARNMVFVGHGIINDLWALHTLGFKFSALLLSILDTSRVANEVFENWAGSLGELLGSLECSYNSLHCAGNDANFTLRALLLLVARGYTKQQPDQDKDSEMLAILQQTGTIPIPYRPDLELEAMKKREKRIMERSRKHERDRAMQSQIRAAQERRRLEGGKAEIRETDMVFYDNEC